jgi:transposase
MATAVGMDIGDRTCQVCVLDPAGEVSERTQVRTTQAGLHRYFSRLEHARVGMEVGTHSPWISKLVMELGHEVYVANARKLRAIYENDSKTDRTDAHLLAEIVQIKPSLLRPIQHRGEQARADVCLLRTRSILVRARTMLINHVRGSVKAVGSRLPACAGSTFHKQLEALPEQRRTTLEPVMKHLRDLTGLIRGYSQAAKEKCDEYPETQILRQVAGVGPITALAFVTTIEDPHRFPKGRKLASYLGLRPRLDESGESRKQLRITKAGDTFLRHLLVQSAQYILGPHGPDTDLKRWGLAIAERGGANAKKRAVVGVARKLAVLLLTLWKRSATYEPLRRAKCEEPAVADAEPTQASARVG